MKPKVPFLAKAKLCEIFQLSLPVKKHQRRDIAKVSLKFESQLLCMGCRNNVDQTTTVRTIWQMEKLSKRARGIVINAIHVF
ncbi:hypothetical protein B8W73_02615 [Arthrobacter agilis]|nr:hypothetical protein B8W73_02615 [Arthrobacter agilis]